MAEALHKSSDIPNFDTYPATPELPAEGETVTAAKTPLEERAGQAGATLGKAVAAVRNIGDRLRTSGDSRGMGDKAKARAQEIGEAAKARAQEIGEVAASRAEEWGRVLRERLHDLRRRARHQLREADVRARRATRDYPLQVALAAGAAGFLVGVLLRIRRASRA
ncbi:MAG TPA: hypothetical protein VJN64_12640 [Terriglobales bacterium]|nr:hypothetical protein [Terriglobales bacterium]